MTDTTPTEGTEHPGCTECGGTGTVYLPDVDGWHPEPCDAYATAEGIEGHEHLWQRRQSVTSKGDAMPAYEVCVIPGCDRARRADRPTSPAPAAEDDAAVLALIDALNVCGDDRGCQCEDAHETAAWVVRRVLDAAGVPALRAEVDRWRAALAESGEQPGDETGARCCTAPDCCGPGSWCCTRAGAHTHDADTWVDPKHLAALAEPGGQPGEARCPECGALGGAHGFVHVRYPQGGGGWNRPCSRRPAPVVPDSADVRERMHENWRVFKKHVPAGAYLPVGQMDGDCRECGGSWPCDAVLAAVGQGVAGECDHARSARDLMRTYPGSFADATALVEAFAQADRPTPSTTTEGES